jgi:hypothetical protein
MKKVHLIPALLLVRPVGICLYNFGPLKNHIPEMILQNFISNSSPLGHAEPIIVVMNWVTRVRAYRHDVASRGASCARAFGVTSRARASSVTKPAS